MAKKSQPAPATPEETPAVAGLVEAPVPFKLERRSGANPLAPDDAAVEAPKMPENARRFRVSLNCPTPLRDKAMEVDARDEREAQIKFDEHNGICGSVHPYSVTEVV